MIALAAVGCKSCWTVCRLRVIRAFADVGKPVRQWTGCITLRSHAVDCQSEMIPLSPQLGNRHVMRSSGPHVVFDDTKARAMARAPAALDPVCRLILIVRGGRCRSHDAHQMFRQPARLAETFFGKWGGRR